MPYNPVDKIKSFEAKSEGLEHMGIKLEGQNKRVTLIQNATKSQK